MSAAAAPAPAALAGTVVDWAVGARLTAELEKIAGSGQSAAVRLAWVERRVNASKHASRAELSALLEDAFIPPARRATASPAVWAAVIAPLRAAGSAILASVSIVDDMPNVRARDVAAAPRGVLADEVTAVLPVDAAWLCAQLDACAAAVVSADDACSALSADYDAIDYTPSRVDRRLRALQLTAPPGPDGATVSERDYAALFEPVRQFRQSMRDALSRALSPDDPASIAAMPAGARLALAVGLLRTVASEAAPPPDRRHALLTFLDVATHCSDDVRLMQAAVDLHAARGALVAFPSDASIVASSCAVLARAIVVADAKQAVVESGGIGLIMEALQRHVELESFVAQMCATIGELAIDTDTHPAFAAAGGAGPILAVLAHHKSADIVEAACYALANLSSSELSTAMRAAGSVKAVLETVRAHTSNAFIVRRSLHALVNMTASGKVDDLLTANVLRVILKALTTHLADPHVAEHGCMLLYHFHGVEGVRLPRELTVLVLVALRLHSSNPVVALHACGVLASASHNDLDRSAEIASAGGLAAVVNAMVAHAGDAAVGEAGCRSLCNLVSAAHGRVLSADQVRAVVGIVSSHANDLEATQSGCWALANIASHAPSRAPLLGAGGIKVFVQAMKRHNDVDVMHHVCRGLASMTQQPGANERLLLEGGIGVVLGGMAAHADNFEAIDRACNLLGVLSTGGALCLTTLAGMGAVSRIIQTAASHMGNRRLASRALLMLSRVCELDAGANDLADSGSDGIALLVNALKTHTDVPVVVSSGLLLLGCLSDDLQVCASIIAHDGAAAAVSALTTTRDPGIARLACRLLENLACTDSAATITAGALTACVAALDARAGDVETATACCSVLSQFAFEASSRAALVAAGGIAAMCRALDAHPTIAETAEEVKHALQELRDCAKDEPVVAKALAEVAATVDAHLAKS